MNKRIKKKKQKLEAMHASKWKYAKLGRKRAHAVGVETRHCLWGLIPVKEHYATYLRNRRRCGKLESEITQHLLSSKILYIQENDRKVVKEKLFLNEGEYNPEKKPVSDEFIPWRMDV